MGRFYSPSFNQQTCSIRFGSDRQWSSNYPPMPNPFFGPPRPWSPGFPGGYYPAYSPFGPPPPGYSSFQQPLTDFPRDPRPSSHHPVDVPPPDFPTTSGLLLPDPLPQPQIRSTDELSKVFTEGLEFFNFNKDSAVGTMPVTDFCVKGRLVSFTGVEAVVNLQNRDEIINDLKDQIKDLTEKVEKRQTEDKESLSKLEASRDELVVHVEALKTHVEQLQKQEGDLTADLKETTDKLESSTQKNEEKDFKIHKLEQELSDAARKTTAIGAKLKRVEKNLADTVDSQKEMKTKFDKKTRIETNRQELTEKIQELNMQVVKSQQQLDESEIKAAALLKNVESAKKVILEHERAISRLKFDLKRSEAKLAVVTNQTETEKQTIFEKDETIERLEHQLSDSVARTASYVTQINENGDKIKELEREVLSKDKQIQNSETKAILLSVRINTQKIEMEQKTETIKKLELELKEANEDLQSYDVKFVTLEAEKLKIEHEQQVRIKDFEAQLAEAQSQIDESEAKISSLLEQFEDQNDTRVTVKSEVFESQIIDPRETALVQELQEKLDKTQKYLDESEAIGQSLFKQGEESRAKIEVLEKELVETRKKNVENVLAADLKNQLTQIRQKLDEAVAKTSSLTSQIQERNTKIAELSAQLVEKESTLTECQSRAVQDVIQQAKIQQEQAAKIVILEKQLSAAQKLQTEAESKVNSSAAQLKQGREAIVKLNTRLHEAEGGIAAVKKELLAAQGLVVAADAKVAQKESENNAQTEKIEELQRSYMKVQKEASESLSKAEKLEQDCLAAKTTITKLKKKLLESNQKAEIIDKAYARIDAVEKELNSTLKSIDASESKNAADHRAKTEQIERLQLELAQSQKLVIESTTEIEKMKEDSKAAEKMAEELREKLIEAERNSKTISEKLKLVESKQVAFEKKNSAKVERLKSKLQEAQKTFLNSVATKKSNRLTAMASVEKKTQKLKQKLLELEQENEQLKQKTREIEAECLAFVETAFDNFEKASKENKKSLQKFRSKIQRQESQPRTRTQTAATVAENSYSFTVPIIPTKKRRAES